jgi:hypothetical protein
LHPVVVIVVVVSSVKLVKLAAVVGFELVVASAVDPVALTSACQSSVPFLRASA